MKNSFEQILADDIEVIEKTIKLDYGNEFIQKNVVEAAQYALSAGGKRIRPVLVLEFCKACGGKAENAESAAAAIEMIHTFSLIHDDLPCMDNDDYRRGKPSCHKAYGEAIALLAGDLLENKAFEIISNDKLINAETKVKLISVLSRYVGEYGMIGGQVIDIENVGKPISAELMEKMDILKTGALLNAAVKMGCICADADEEKLTAAGKYADSLGMAFQIVDDILDVTGGDGFGKPAGSDAENGKATYASVYGIEKATELAEKYTVDALDALTAFENTGFLTELTKMLCVRKK